MSHRGPERQRLKPRPEGSLADSAALVTLVGQDEPPLRFPAGADAVNTFEQKAQSLLAQADAHRELSTSLAHADADADA